MKKVYLIEGLDCANCAAKIEDKINKLEGINEATINFMTSKLSIEFNSGENSEIAKVMEEVKKIIAKIEPDAKLS